MLYGGAGAGLGGIGKILAAVAQWKNDNTRWDLAGQTANAALANDGGGMSAAINQGIGPVQNTPPIQDPFSSSAPLSRSAINPQQDQLAQQAPVQGTNAQSAQASASQMQVQPIDPDMLVPPAKGIAHPQNEWTPEKLQRFLYHNPEYLKDPKKINELVHGAGTDWKFQYDNNTGRGVWFNPESRAVIPIKVGGVAQPNTTLAKLNQDRENGLINQADYDAQKAKLNSGELRDVPGGGAQVVTGPHAGDIVSAGMFNVLDKNGHEHTLTYSNTDEYRAIMRGFANGDYTQTSIGGRQPTAMQNAQAQMAVAAARERGKYQEDARQQLSLRRVQTAQFGDMLRDVKSSPEGAFGSSGKLGAFLGGMVGQVDQGMGQALTQAITGAPEHQLAGLRQNARLLVQAVVPLATGEDSGRVSESERQIANEAVGILSSAADKTQAVTGLMKLYELHILGNERLRIESGLQSVYPNLESDPHQLAAAASDLKERGFDQNTAAETLRHMIQMRHDLSGKQPVGF